jgi:hypothetical protein
VEEQVIHWLKESTIRGAKVVWVLLLDIRYGKSIEQVKRLEV